MTHQSAQNEDCYNRKVIFQNNYERINEKIDNSFNLYSKEKTLFDFKISGQQKKLCQFSCFKHLH